MSDNLKFFEGWKCACEDVAQFLEHLHENSPPEVKHFTESYVQFAQAVREKGNTGMAQAEAIISPSN